MLWHGNVDEALERIEDLLIDLHWIEVTASPAARKLSTSLTDLQTYITNNRGFIPNYGERHRQGEVISTAFVESTINQVVSRRFVKEQQMRWTLRGAHLRLQTRTKVLNDDLESTFRRWYPRFREAAPDSLTLTESAKRDPSQPRPDERRDPRALSRTLKHGAVRNAGTLWCYIVPLVVTISRDLLRLKLAESLAVEPRALTRRDVRLPGVRGKAFAVIGVRRCGKTSFLARYRADRMAEGRPRDAQLFLSLEDERLAGLEVSDLRWLLEEHARQAPRSEGSRMSLYLDEVQTVPGWEGLVRRLIDEGGIEIFVSGSSAKLLSREVATSLRGRAMEVLLQPFSFREALRHLGEEPSRSVERLSASARATLDARLRRYLAEGGFPEAQGLVARDRMALLNGYVDVVVLRDIIERHAVSNPLALRWIQRQLLANPGGHFSVKNHYDTLRSQGVSVGKDTLHEYLAHLEDAFLVRTVAMHSASERQRMVNPRKAYPVDPGLIALFERSGRTHLGRALETAVLIELERRGWEVSYVRTSDGLEVDFLAHRAGDPPLLVQVCLESQGDETWTRELRALQSAASAHPDARKFLVTLDAVPPEQPMPPDITWAPASRWLLEEV